MKKALIAFACAVCATSAFAEVGIDRISAWLPGAGSARDEAELACQVGLLARLLRSRGADDTMRKLLIEELADRLTPYVTADGVRLPALLHLVTAALPG